MPSCPVAASAITWCDSGTWWRRARSRPDMRSRFGVGALLAADTDWVVLCVRGVAAPVLLRACARKAGRWDEAGLMAEGARRRRWDLVAERPGSGAYGVACGELGQRCLQLRHARHWPEAMPVSASKARAGVRQLAPTCLAHSARLRPSARSASSPDANRGGGFEPIEAGVAQVRHRPPPDLDESPWPGCKGCPACPARANQRLTSRCRVAGGSAVSVIVRKNGISGNATSSFAVRQRSSTASRPTVSSGCSPGPTCLPVGNHRPGLDGHTAVSIILAGPAGRFQ